MTPDAAPLGNRGRVRAVILALAAIAGWLEGLTFVALGSVFASALVSPGRVRPSRGGSSG
jgi:hypothetical protein